MIPLRDLNPTRRLPVITVVFVAINVLVFLYEQTLSERGLTRLFLQYGVVPGRFFDGNITLNDGLTLVTSMFLHGGWLHVGGNLLYLWIFGNNIEDRLGAIRYIGFYFITGFVASALQIIIEPSSRLPMIGASGAIAGVLGGYIVLFPRARVQTLVVFFVFIQVVSVSAALLLGWWFLIQLFNGVMALGDYAQGGVAFFAHIGGFIAGAILIRLFTLGRRPDDWWRPPGDLPGRTSNRWWE
ncbi:MAG: rhomboid family intramembrane serine protease [Chloroflexi bacterium]|nr:rhomboid family intramembrane serine protease [Chloroflexota bacterium]